MINTQIKEAMDLKQSRIDKAIDKKEKQIAYFNSLNAAIAHWSKFPDAKVDDILLLRDKFYAEWKNWYAQNILDEQVGGEEIDLPIK